VQSPSEKGPRAALAMRGGQPLSPYRQPERDRALRVGVADPTAARLLPRCGILPVIRRSVITAGPCRTAAGADGALPSVARDDATHIPIAAVDHMDCLVTWNHRHIDNAEAKPLICSVCAVHGYVCPEICTPEELMGRDTR
jgi:hypothetical protein